MELPNAVPNAIYIMLLYLALASDTPTQISWPSGLRFAPFEYFRVLRFGRWLNLQGLRPLFGVGPGDFHTTWSTKTSSSESTL